MEQSKANVDIERTENTRDKRHDDGEEEKASCCGRNEQRWFMPRSGKLFNPFDDLEYVGGRDEKNPARFVDDFERIAKYEMVTDYDELYFFDKCMKQKAW